MFTIFDKCYHRPRTCDLMDELRTVQNKLFELEKQERPKIPVIENHIFLAGAFADWIQDVARGVTIPTWLPDAHWVIASGKEDPQDYFTNFLYEVSDYLKRIADFRQNISEHETKKAELMQRETELKKQLGIK